jgi:hypothetical protein
MWFNPPDLDAISFTELGTNVAGASSGLLPSAPFVINASQETLRGEGTSVAID